MKVKEVKCEGLQATVVQRAAENNFKGVFFAIINCSETASLAREVFKTKIATECRNYAKQRNSLNTTAPALVAELRNSTFVKEVEIKTPFLYSFDRVDFLEDFHGKPRLKRSHKHYTQMQAKMWVWGVCHGYFIVGTQGGPPFYERVELDMEFCLNVVNNITLFYKSFVLPCLLGYRNIFTCPKCNKVILEEDEISYSVKENNICCNTCSIWWHLSCADHTMSTADALDSWVCQSCLADVANAVDSDKDDLEFNFGQESEETITSMDLNHICPVCSMKSIPVNGEHVCTVCKQAVHAWCSNHENITSSTHLLCNYCISD